MTENVMQFRPKQTVNAILANLLSMKTGWKQPLRKREIKMSRIQQTFAALDGAKALIPYIAVGDPNLDTTLALMHSLVENGADILELGVPFSDPMADGPTIQRAAERALANKVSLNDVLNIVRRFRETNGNTPVVLMGYLNPIHKIGYQAFAQAAAEAGVDGVLTVDSPVETITPLHDELKSRGIGVLITDHNVRETLSICDRAYIISDGTVLASGKPDDLVNNEQVRSVYLGENFKY